MNANHYRSASIALAVALSITAFAGCGEDPEALGTGSKYANMPPEDVIDVIIDDGASDEEVLEASTVLSARPLLQFRRQWESEAIGGNVEERMARMDEKLKPYRKLVGEDLPPAVQANGARVLGKLQDVDSFPSLLALAESPHPAVRNSAIAALGRISGLNFKVDPKATDDEAHKQALASYRNFWKEAQGDPQQNYIRMMKDPVYRKQVEDRAKEKLRRDKQKEAAARANRS